MITAVVDCFSKAAQLIALATYPTAQQTADLILKEVVQIYGPPVNLLSDCGPQFIARFWRSFWKQLGVELSITLGYHPQSNDQTERVNQELLKHLRCYCSHRPTAWANHLFLAELAHNQLHSSSTGLSV